MFIDGGWLKMIFNDNDCEALSLIGVSCTYYHQRGMYYYESFIFITAS